LLADINNDGVVDLNDAIEMIIFLTNMYGAESVAPLTPTYFDDYDFNWDQASWDQATEFERQELFAVNEGDAMQVVPSFIENAHRNLQQCGQSSFGHYTKGTGPRPTINWNNGYPYNSNAKATLKDYANWVYYGILLEGTLVLGKLPNSTQAFARYRDKSGSELSVDYEKAIDEDPTLKAAIDAEIQAVATAVMKLHDGREASGVLAVSPMTCLPAN
jgi:hypothetical protein